MPKLNTPIDIAPEHAVAINWKFKPDVKARRIVLDKWKHEPNIQITFWPDLASLPTATDLADWVAEYNIAAAADEEVTSEKDAALVNLQNYTDANSVPELNAAIKEIIKVITYFHA